MSKDKFTPEIVHNTRMSDVPIPPDNSPQARAVTHSPELLAQGETRFNVYCAPCHDRTGLGKGMVPQRWPAWQPADLSMDRLVEAADGDLFNVITYGRRTMPPYGWQNDPAERWAIVAYVRVLQRAQHGKMDDVPEQSRTGLEYKPGPPPIEAPSLDEPSKDGKQKGAAK